MSSYAETIYLKGNIVCENNIIEEFLEIIWPNSLF